MTDVNEPTTTVAEAQPQRGFQIGDSFYPFPTSFKVLDPVLVAEISGLPWEAFIATLEKDEEWLNANGAPPETLMLAALLATAVWHVHPEWTRQAVIRYVQALDESDLDILGVSEDAVVPPAEPATPPATETTATGLVDGSPSESEPPPASS